MSIFNKINKFISLANRQNQLNDLLSDAWGGNSSSFIVFLDLLEEEKGAEFSQMIKDHLKGAHSKGEKFRILKTYFPDAFPEIKFKPGQIDGFFRTLLDGLSMFSTEQYLYNRDGSTISFSKGQLKKLVQQIQKLLYGSDREYLGNDQEDIDNLSDILNNISVYI